VAADRARASEIKRTGGIKGRGRHDGEWVFEGREKTANDPFAREDVPRRGCFLVGCKKKKKKKKRERKEKKKEKKKERKEDKRKVAHIVRYHCKKRF